MTHAKIRFEVNMEYKEIDIDTWPRKAHFNFFKELDMPFFNMTAKLEVSSVKKLSKSLNTSFTLTLLHIIIKEINNIEDFRVRIKNGKPVLLDKIHVGSTVPALQSTFLYAKLNFHHELKSFVEAAEETISDTVKENLLKPNDGIDMIYFTSIPWVSYTHISHAKNIDKNDFIPRIAIGKYTKHGDSISIPLSIEVNHAVCDGYHVGLLYQNIQSAIDKI